MSWVGVSCWRRRERGNSSCGRTDGARCQESLASWMCHACVFHSCCDYDLYHMSNMNGNGQVSSLDVSCPSRHSTLRKMHGILKMVAVQRRFVGDRSMSCSQRNCSKLKWSVELRLFQPTIFKVLLANESYASIAAAWNTFIPRHFSISETVLNEKLTFLELK